MWHNSVVETEMQGGQMDCTMSGMDDKSMIYTRPKSNHRTRSAVCLHDTAGARCHVVYLVVLVTKAGISDGKLKMAYNQPSPLCCKRMFPIPLFFSDF